MLGDRAANTFTEPAGARGGVQEIVYSHAGLALAAGDALVLEIDDADAPLWDVQLYNRPWYEALDAAGRTTTPTIAWRSPTRTTASAWSSPRPTPALPNWLDTESRPEVLATIAGGDRTDAPVRLRSWPYRRARCRPRLRPDPDDEPGVGPPTPPGATAPDPQPGEAWEVGGRETRSEARGSRDEGRHATGPVQPHGAHAADRCARRSDPRRPRLVLRRRARLGDDERRHRRRHPVPDATDEGQFILVAEHKRPLQAPGYDHLGLLCETRAEVDELLEQCQNWAGRRRPHAVKVYDDLDTGNLVVHAFYIKFLLPIWFDIQCMEWKTGGPAALELVDQPSDGPVLPEVAAWRAGGRGVAADEGETCSTSVTPTASASSR